MDVCPVVVTVLMSVPLSPNTPKPTSPMTHNVIIVVTHTLFSLCRTADCITTREREGERELERERER